MFMLLLTNTCASGKLVVSGDHSSARGAPVIVKIREEQIAATVDNTVSQISPPYFDAGGQLRWEKLLPAASSSCANGITEVERITLMLSPRVDRARCPRDGNLRSTKEFLVGVNEQGKTIWQRQLGFISGTFTVEETVIGASPDGIVLNNLTVIAPSSGDIVTQAPTHRVGREQRPMPDYDLTGSALYLADRQGLLWFSADVTLIERKGGLYLIDAATGQKDLLAPVSTTLLGGYWRIEQMATAQQDDRHIFLAQRFAIRGPGGVSLAVFDLEQRKIVYEDRFGEGHFCSEPQIVSGSGNSFGFAYIDKTIGKRILIHYRLLSSKQKDN
jgi:hypothetical protein